MAKNIEFKVEGMGSDHCAKRVNDAIKNVDGVLNVNVTLENKSVKVEFDENKTCENHIFKSVEDSGYKVIK